MQKQLRFAYMGFAHKGLPNSQQPGKAEPDLKVTQVLIVNNLVSVVLASLIKTLVQNFSIFANSAFGSFGIGSLARHIMRNNASSVSIQSSGMSCLEVIRPREKSNNFRQFPAWSAGASADLTNPLSSMPTTALKDKST